MENAPCNTTARRRASKRNLPTKRGASTEPYSSVVLVSVRSNGLRKSTSLVSHEQFADEAGECSVIASSFAATQTHPAGIGGDVRRVPTPHPSMRAGSTKIFHPYDRDSSSLTPSVRILPCARGICLFGVHREGVTAGVLARTPLLFSATICGGRFRPHPPRRRTASAIHAMLDRFIMDQNRSKIPQGVLSAAEEVVSFRPYGCVPDLLCDTLSIARRGLASFSPSLFEISRLSSTANARIHATDRRPDPTLRHPGFADPPSRSDLHSPQRPPLISSHPPRHLLGLVSRGSWRLPVDMVFFVDHVEEKRYRSASIDVEHVWHTRGSEERETSQGSTEKRWWKRRREKGLRRGETRDGPGSRNVRRLGNEWTQNVLQRQHGHGKATTWVPGSVEKSRDLEHGRGCEAHSTGDREGCQELVGHRTSTWRRTTEKWQVLQAPLVQPAGSSPQQRTV